MNESVQTWPSDKGYSWDFLKKFRIEAARSVHGWQAIRGLIEKSRQAIIPRIRECQDLERQWEERLRPLCGDQTILDWRKFRPLRLNREEDWSDWLAWLLETSATGNLAESLFGRHMDCQIETFISPTVDREVPVDDRRADIVITWNTKQNADIEVKVWDPHFEKTFETAEKLHKTTPDSDWNDFILIPATSQQSWNEVAQAHAERETIKVETILWEDVVRGLRKCLWHGHESVFWRAWAWAFCSTIEAEILCLERLDKLQRPGPNQIQMVLRWLDVLNLNCANQYE